MKKTSYKKISKFLLAPIGKGVLIFAIFGAALYVYAATVTFPTDEPHPVTGVVGMFVGLSTDGYDSSVDSYETMNDKCTAYNAHVCTAMEIMNSYNHYPLALPASGVGIMNSGPPGYTVFANDCNGWGIKTAQYLATDAFATVWDFDGDAASLSRCDIISGNTSIFKVACCK